MGRTNCKLHLDGRLCIFLALMLLLLPLKWVMAMVVAAVIHELWHGLAVVFFGGRIYAIHFTGAGIKMETEPLPAGRELIVALAGPVGSASLLLLSNYFPRTAVCGAVHCLYNLLPLFPLDGGRVVQNAIALFAPVHRQEPLFRISQGVVRGALAVFGVFTVVRWGLLPGAVVLGVMMRQRKWK